MASYPWFKFDAESWLSGKIQFLPPAHQGILTNLCALIWKHKNAIALQELSMRYARDMQVFTDALDDMVKLGVIVRSHDDELSVKFMMEQLDQAKVRSNKRRDAANKRWGNDASALQDKKDALQKNAEERRGDKKEIRGEGEETSDSSKTAPPPPPDFDSFFLSLGCYIGNDQSWFEGCYNKFKPSFLNTCVRICRDERHNKGLKPKVCKSDLEVVIRKQHRAMDDSEVFL